MINNDATIDITVDSCTVTETNSERLPRLIVSNDMTWQSHKYENDKNKGLLMKLKRGAAMIRGCS